MCKSLYHQNEIFDSNKFAIRCTIKITFVKIKFASCFTIKIKFVKIKFASCFTIKMKFVKIKFASRIIKMESLTKLNLQVASPSK